MSRLKSSSCTVCDRLLFDPPQAIGILEQAQHLAEQTGDRRGLAETSLNLSRAARHMLDIKAAFNYGEQALALARDIEGVPINS